MESNPTGQPSFPILWILAAFPSACPHALLSLPGKLPKKVPSRRKPQPGPFQVGPPLLLHPHTSTPPQCPTRNPTSWPLAPVIQQADTYHHTGFISLENHRENLEGSISPHPKFVRRPPGTWLTAHFCLPVLTVLGLLGLGSCRVA